MVFRAIACYIKMNNLIVKRFLLLVNLVACLWEICTCMNFWYLGVSVYLIFHATMKNSDNREFQCLMPLIQKGKALGVGTDWLVYHTF